MLKTIFSAIATALRGIGGLMKAVAAAPGRRLMRVLGGGGYEPPDAPAYDALADQAEIKEKSMTASAEIALIVQEWAAQSIIAGDPVPVPPILPPETRSWLRGLSRADAALIVKAEKHAVSGHLQRYFLIEGLPPVRSMAPSGAWPSRPRPSIISLEDDFSLHDQASLVRP